MAQVSSRVDPQVSSTTSTASEAVGLVCEHRWNIDVRVRWMQRWLGYLPGIRLSGSSERISLIAIAKSGVQISPFVLSERCDRQACPFRYALARMPLVRAHCQGRVATLPLDPTCPSPETSYAIVASIDGATAPLH